jgi:hypothetical protein
MLKSIKFLVVFLLVSSVAFAGSVGLRAIPREEIVFLPGSHNLKDSTGGLSAGTIARTSDDMLPDGSGWARGDRDILIPAENRNPTSADSWWDKTNCTIDDSGGIVADSTDSESKEVRATSVVVNPTNETYLFQVKVLKGAKNFVRLRSWNATDGAKNAFFDLDNGIEGPSDANPPVDSGMSGPDSEGYYTCWIVSTVTASSHFYINPSATSGAAGVAFAAADTTNPLIYVKEIMLEEVPSDLALGDELVTNGDMELDANWTDFNTPTTRERSSTQAHAGTYSQKFTVDAQYEGVRQDNDSKYTVVAGNWYKVVVWVYPDDTTTVLVAIKKGDNSGDDAGGTYTGLTQDDWNEITIYYQAAASGSLAYVYVLSPAVTSSGTWYVDDVSVKEVPLSVWTDALGPLQKSGTLTIGTTYQIISTETDHFYAGCAVNDVFEAAAETALDANNTVKEVGAFIQPSPYTNASTIPAEGAFVDGWHYVQNATVLNLLPYSNDFDEWTMSAACSRTIGELSPSGDYDAWLLYDNGTGASNALSYSFATLTDDEPNTFSVFAQDTGSSAKFSLALYDFDAPTYRSLVNFTWSAGVLSASAVVGTGDVVSLGNGWYRAYVTCPASTIVGANDNRILLYPSGQNTTNEDSHVFWLPNLTETAVPYRPIPTNGVPAYTTPETVSVALSDGLKNIVSKLQGDATSEGTMVVEFTPLYNNPDSAHKIISVGESNPILGVSGTLDRFYTYDSTTVAYTQNGEFADESGTTLIIAVKWSDTAGKYRIGVKDGSGWAWGTEQNYDGGYDVSTYLLIGYDNPYPFAWRNLRFFRRALPTDIIEANF